ncbi:ComEA family DNA-binding protein [Demequina sp. TTPB684]|uniref:ComEA family DNA-binding protein n=1 Tax=unclassified Demequina TaxID=2620311 RepID=UPI001CF2F81D|nr:MULTISPECIES: ComEA family DNA-binding protein [unclassified Demequina]MCB2411824.1 ComEA family DNA-binding protein [Demequina sp. TTPB684]UPU88952.1 ComEA family DNA-binding protein [Demequina sp. TMPB413]
MDSSPDVTARVDHALRQAAARAYEAANGALGEDVRDAQPARWRWEVSPRVAVTVAILAAIIGAVVVWGPGLAGPGPRAPVGEMEGAAGGEGGMPASGDLVGGAGVGGLGGDGAAVNVHVAGAVTQPGVYELPAGSRVTDALEAAGGAVEGAQLDAINLARVVADGEQVSVPTVAEADAQGTGRSDGRININSADAGLLEDLPGVGPVLADRIVAYREDHGPFASVEGLDAVSGVGPAVLEGLLDAATV